MAITSLLSLSPLQGALPEGLYVWQARPADQTGMLSHLYYQIYGDTPAFTSQGLFDLCRFSFCTAPYQDLKALTIRDDSLLAVERDAATGLFFLSRSLGTTGFQRLQPAEPLNVTNPRALVWTGTQLLAAAAGETAGSTRLYELSPTTGQLLATSFPLIPAEITALAWDATQSLLYARTAGSPPRLQRLSLPAAQLTAIGALPAELTSLAWVPPLGLVSLSDVLVLIDSKNAACTPLVSGPTYTAPGATWLYHLCAKGSYQIAPAPPLTITPGLGPITSAIQHQQHTTRVNWTSRGRSISSIYYSPDCKFYNWQLLDYMFSNTSGQALQYSHTVHPLARDEGFYRLHEFPRAATQDGARLLIGLVFALGAMVGMRRPDTVA